MTFPTDPLDVTTELYLGGDWTDVTDDVLQRDRITITRGRPDEARTVDPSTCTLSLKNTAGKYSPRNPRSPYFGTFGRNTPLRVAIGRESDDFNRTVSNGWGTASDGPVWQASGLGGTVALADFNVTGGVATHSLPVSAAFRFNYLEELSYRDVEVCVSWQLSAGDITGASVEPATIQLRGQNTGLYYQARVEVTAVQQVRCVIIDTTQAELASVIVPHLNYLFPEQVFRVRAGIAGATIRMRVWDTAGPEPRDWHITASDPDPLMTPGWIGIRSGVAGGNTNTKPFVFSYSDFEVRLPRFAGEVSAWPPRWDTSGNDVWVPITASGITRRLGQGTSPLRSPLYREMTSPSNADALVAYWPCEDGQGANEIASESPAPPMRLSATGVQLGSSSAIPGSEPLPVLSTGGFLTGDVPAAPDGAFFYRQAITFPNAGTIPDNAPLLSVSTTGSARRWDLVYVGGFGGSFVLQAYNSLGTLVDDTARIDFGLDSQRLKLEFELTQNGSAVDILIVCRFIQPDNATVSSFVHSDTMPGLTVGHATRIVIGPAQNLADVAVGHISVGSDQTFAFAMGPALVGNAGETTASRIGRLAAEEGVPMAVAGAAASTVALGSQRTTDLLTLLRDAETADGGVLYEPRSDIALEYRARATAYNQDVALALDYTAEGEVAPPLEPAEDDQHLRNDVQVQRQNGSSATYTLESGPLSVQPPPDGVGVYDDQITLSLAFDHQNLDQAAWRVHLGTWNEARYPTVHVNLAAAPHLIVAATAVDVHDRLTITNPPPWLPPGDVDLLVEGYSETLDIYGWDLTYNCSPGGPWLLGKLEDPVLGRADTDGSELTADITATATTLSVATTSGPVWITGSAAPAFPFDVRLATGEVVTVTAISGTSSPQTFTAARGTNGITLAAPAGTTLSLANPMRVAL